MKEKINIGLFIDAFFPMIDGVVMVVDNYAKRLSKYANVYVFAPSPYNKKIDDSKRNYNVIRCQSIPVPFLDYSLPLPKIDHKFLKQLNSIKLDIVHIHSPATLGRVGFKYAKKNGIPVIATFHSQYYQDFMRTTKSITISKKLLKSIMKLYDECDECWAVNQEVGRIFHEEYGYKKMPIVKNNATEMIPSSNIEKSIERINNLHNLKDEYVFLFVGRLNKLKNILFIVDSLHELKDLNYKMLFVGNGHDEEELKERIKQLKLEDKIILCGRVTDRDLLRDYYVRADLFLFPSMYDASSIVQIEAASQKTPGLFLENSATSCNIINNHNGYISKNNIKEYANRIKEILSNKEEYKKVCNNAFNELYINWDKEIENVYKTYLEIIERNK